MPRQPIAKKPEKQPCIGDKLDFFSADIITGGMVAALMEQSVRTLKAIRQDILDELPKNVVSTLTSEVFPQLATLRKSIVNAYDPEMGKTDAKKFNAALKAVQQSTADSLNDVVSSTEERHNILSALILGEAAMALKEPIPTKGQKRG